MSRARPQDREWRYFVAALVAVDLLCLTAALLLAGWLASNPTLGRRVAENTGQFIPLVLPLFAVIFFTQGLYNPQNLLGGTREYAAVARACTYGLVGLVLLGFIVRQPVSRAWPLLSYGLATVLIGGERFLMRRVAYRFRRRGLFTTRTIVAGVDADSVGLAKQLGEGGSGIKVIGFLDDYIPVGSVISDGLTVLGRPQALLRVAARTGAHEAIINPQALPWETVQGLMTDAASAPDGLRVHLSAGFYELLITNVRLCERNRIPLLTLTRASLTPFETIFKTTLDYVLASALLVGFAPVLLWTALRLRLEGGGRILERRRVFGRYGRRFDQLSFRSQAQIRWDFIRKLPALVNVLAGQLSLVGPRPIGATEAGTIEPRSKFQTLRPGLTGPWRQAEDASEQAILDLYYIRSYSIWLDLQVLITRVRTRFRRATKRDMSQTDARELEQTAR